MSGADILSSLEEISDVDLLAPKWDGEGCDEAGRGCSADLYDVMLGSDDDATCLPAAAALLLEGVTELSVSAAQEVESSEPRGRGMLAGLAGLLRSFRTRMHLRAAG